MFILGTEKWDSGRGNDSHRNEFFLTIPVENSLLPFVQNELRIISTK